MKHYLGNVIKAWDLGVATMKRGELAVLYCKSNYAYGESGSPPKIPPNATLVFEVNFVQKLMFVLVDLIHFFVLG